MGLLFGGNLIRWIDRWGLSLELTITRKEQFNSNSRENRNMAGMRQWTRLRSETSSGTIRLATYNILAQHYVDTMPHLYQHCFRSKKSHLLQWINRWDLIRNDLESLQSDICCLQEVQAEHFAVYIEPFLKSKNYEIIYG